MLPSDGITKSLGRAAYCASARPGKDLRVMIYMLGVGCTRKKDRCCGIGVLSRGKFPALASSLATFLPASRFEACSPRHSIFNPQYSIGRQETISYHAYYFISSIAVQLTCQAAALVLSALCNARRRQTVTFRCSPASVLLEHQSVGCKSSPKLEKSQCDGPMEKLCLTLGHYA
jgi:hypothetical protein